jgi:hypothetical protein
MSIEIEMAKKVVSSLMREAQRFSANAARPHLVRALQRFPAALYSSRQLGA